MIKKTIFVFLVFCSALSADSYRYLELLKLHPEIVKELRESIRKVGGGEKSLFKDLEGGMSSTKLYCFSAEEKKYVLRIFPAKYPAQKRAKEVQAHQIAAQMGIAPKLLYVDKKANVLLMPFVDGHTLSFVDLKSPRVLRNLGKSLQKFHSYSGSFDQNRTQLARVKKHYERALKKGVSFPTIMAKVYEEYVKESQLLEKEEKVLCHGDLNPNNILVTDDGNILIIDWTNATWEDPCAEIAYLTFLSGFTPRQTEAFLQAYLGRSPTVSELNQLNLYQKRVSFLTSTIWFDFSESPDALKVPMKERVDHLDRHLRSPCLMTGTDYIRSGEIVSPTSGDHDAIKWTALGFLKTYITW